MDINTLAKSIVDQATGEKPQHDAPKSEDKKTREDLNTVASRVEREATDKN